MGKTTRDELVINVNGSDQEYCRVFIGEDGTAQIKITHPAYGDLPPVRLGKQGALRVGKFLCQLSVRMPRG